MNTLKTSLLLAVPVALTGAAGYAVGGGSGLAWGLASGAAAAGLAWSFSARLVLKVHGALPVHRHDAPTLYDTIEKLAARAHVPMPGVYVVNEAQPNAFAVGRGPGDAAVAVTTGLMHALRPYEVAAVVAHALARIASGDVRPMTITAGIAAAITAPAAVLALLGAGRNGTGRNRPLSGMMTVLFALLAPVAAFLVQAAVSRERAFDADAGGAAICGQPLRLASALRKIRRAWEKTANRHAETNPATAHLFVVNPLRAKGLNRLFSTHPATRARVRRLEKIAVAHFDMQFGRRRPKRPRSIAA